MGLNHLHRHSCHGAERGGEETVLFEAELVPEFIGAAVAEEVPGWHCTYPLGFGTCGHNNAGTQTKCQRCNRSRHPTLLVRDHGNLNESPEKVKRTQANMTRGCFDASATPVPELPEKEATTENQYLTNSVTEGRNSGGAS